MGSKSDLEALFRVHLKAAKLYDGCEEEFKFMDNRRFKFDFAWPIWKIAVEIEGGTYAGKSRHTTGKGFKGDCIKYNFATSLGWQVYRGDSEMVRKGELIVFLTDVFKAARWESK